jgi:transposase-like protein
MKTTSPTRSSRSAAQWAALVEESESSNLSIRAFCERSDVPIGQFYAWRSKLRTTAESKRGGFTPVRLQAAVEVEPQKGTTGSVEVVLQNGRIVRVLGSVDACALRAVINVAEGGEVC